MTSAALALFAISLVGPATVQVEPLKFDPAALGAMEQREIRVVEKGVAVAYKGVPLRVLLADQLKGGNAMVNLRDLTDAVLLVRATDDYQAAVSAVEVAMDEKGERYLLALERDGKPLGENQGPAKLVIPADPKPVRWVRMISSVDLVRMPKAKGK